MKTLLLDQTAWDLVLDSAANVAVASDPYSQAQDTASEAQTFEGEVYYDTTLGLPYFQSILGKRPPAQLLKAEYIAAAFRVPGIVAATCFLTSVGPRKLGGQIQITNQAGVTLPAPTVAL